MTRIIETLAVLCLPAAFIVGFSSMWFAGHGDILTAAILLVVSLAMKLVGFLVDSGRIRLR